MWEDYHEYLFQPWILNKYIFTEIIYFAPGQRIVGGQLNLIALCYGYICNAYYYTLK